MSFGSRLRERREELGLKQSELGKMLGVTGSAIGNYENGVSSPKADILHQVFDVLKCDANYLFQDEMKELETDDFSVPEIKMVKKYRLLDNYGKEAVDSVLNVEWRRCEAEKNPPKMEMADEIAPEVLYIFPFFISGASAGTGQLAGDDYPEELALTKRPPRGTSYVVPVNGNSMEPTYCNGDKLFVRSCEEIRPGQIGIFFMDGQQWVKELGDGVLISHNPDYDPIPMREDIRCQGLVLGVCDGSYFE